MKNDGTWREPAKRVMSRIESLGAVSDEPKRLTRSFGSPAMRRANELVGQWMREAGMAVREDAIGNLIGHYAAGDRPKAKGREAKLLLLGSHLDTVRDAGKFDGALGVILAIECVEQLNRQGLRFPFGIEVIGFADEEGVRFQTALLGSRALAGGLSQADLQRTDADGITLAEAIRRFKGGQPELEKARLKPPGQLLGYLEAHIEQGPVLEDKKSAVGIVSAIAGQSRFQISFTGQAGHAGTVPMDLRRDALCAAAEFIMDVERQAWKTPGLVATVGRIEVEPNVSNVIPGTVSLSLDVRHPHDPVRVTAGEHLWKVAQQLGAARGARAARQVVQQTDSVPCDPRLTDLLRRAAQGHQSRVLTLPSGAGHDAVAMAKLTPVAMLFIRCRGGLSHHPAESVDLPDVEVALSAMGDFVRLVAGET